MNGWILGYIIGAVVVVVVVLVLLAMIVGARQTAEKAEAILAGLHDARDGTAPIRDLGATVHTAKRIVGAAAKARLALSGGGES